MLVSQLCAADPPAKIERLAYKTIIRSNYVAVERECR